MILKTYIEQTRVANIPKLDAILLLHESNGFDGGGADFIFSYEEI